ncbi:zinc finger BED domain-containing protein 5-like [Sipha flava]|uniref:Zinc finger BED domain-containing protein 5-like n=1 Tax=Sipha flava TaxID=143950 RepID=A0A8B8GI22_9HEMI|nr:zinc finger BED domain-containing protein 5-like [Sipha flava]
MDKFLKRKHDSSTDSASTNTSNVNDDTFNDENKIKKVAEIIAKQLKPYTIAESLILPACSEIVQIMFGDDAKKEIMKIPHSDDTIKNRIIHMSDDIEKTITNKLTTNKLYFALQIDESTDISGIAHVLGFVRFIDENKIVNQFLCCKQLTERTTGQNVFDSISSYLDKFNITWDQCVGICTDGAPSMVGSIKGFTTLAKKKNPNIISTHCFLHRESLISKTLPITLKSILDKIVSMVNFIKSRPLQSRLFKKLCESMETQHVCLLLHCEVRWLSRGKVLNRILELKNELLMFFQNEDNTVFISFLTDDIWCVKMAYLADIFNYLNSVNAGMQVTNTNMYGMQTILCYTFIV